MEQNNHNEDSGKKEEGLVKVLFVAVCVSVISAIFIAALATNLKPRQDVNKAFDKEKNILYVAKLVSPTEVLTVDKMRALFKEHVQSFLVDLKTGKTLEGNPDTFDVDRELKNFSSTVAYDAKEAEGTAIRVPQRMVVYRIVKDGKLDSIVFPFYGKGLWSTLKGFVAVESDLKTFRGLTFYEHGETPGLGGEVDNPAWKVLWDGRRIYDDQGNVGFHVIKGIAGNAKEDPYRIDGISGSTLTSRGVDNALRFWLGKNAYGNFLARVAEEEKIDKGNVEE